MPRGPKGEKRPADVVGNAVHVMRIATGDVEEALPSGKTRSGHAGGKARAKVLAPEKRSEIARKAAKKRWT